MRDHQIRMRSLLITAAKSMTLAETPGASALEASAQDTDDDYFGVAKTAILHCHSYRAILIDMN